jgi:hypothetical protein
MRLVWKRILWSFKADGFKSNAAVSLIKKLTNESVEREKKKHLNYV